MMVDVKLNSRKLEERAKRILIATTNVDYKTASEYLRRADGHVKTALIMIKKNIPLSEAKIRLAKTNGFVRKALKISATPKSKKRSAK